MKKSVLTIIISVVITIITILVLIEIKAQKDQLRADKVEKIDSEILGESRKFLVHLPRDYDSTGNKKYPVLYALDATSHDQDVLNATNILNLANLLPDLIIIGIVNKNRKKDQTPNYIMIDNDPSAVGKGDVFLDFLEKEAIPFIDKNYRTTDYRMISGNSRAGLFSFFTMLEKPNLFNAYFCYSPAFWRNENVIADIAEELLANENQLNDKFIYLSLGTHENDKMKKGFDQVIDVLNQTDSLGLKLFYDYTENANHGTNAYYSIPKALKIWSENR